MITILFVCYANICRSPVAEGLFRQEITRRGWAEHIHVDSVSVSSIAEGHHPATHSIIVAEERGVSIADHVARQIMFEDIFEADYLVAMDHQVKQRLMDRIAAADAEHLAPKIVLLRDFDPQGSGDVADPIGRAIPAFQEMAAVVARCVESLADFIADKHGL